MPIISQAIGAAAITAAAGGTFVSGVVGPQAVGAQLNLLAPASGRLNGVQFIVRASGSATIAAGTYTSAQVNLQPVLYGVAGGALWTAATANAIFSATALNLLYTNTVATSFPWVVEAKLIVDAVSGKLQGSVGSIINGTVTAPATLAATAPTSVAPNGADPMLQFAVGVAAVAGVSSLVLDQFELDAA